MSLDWPPVKMRSLWVFTGSGVQPGPPAPLVLVPSRAVWMARPMSIGAMLSGVCSVPTVPVPGRKISARLGLGDLIAACQRRMPLLSVVNL